MKSGLSKKERTRKHIIESSAKLFNVKGVEATSLTDIEIATNLTKGSIYSNFDNKDELAIAVFKYNVSLLNRDIMAVLRGVDSNKDKLKAYCRYYKDNYRRHFELGGCPVLNTAVESDDTHPDMRDLVNKVINNWHTTIANIIADGKEMGEFTDMVDPKQFASAFISLIEGGVLLSKTTGDKTYLLNNLAQIEQWVDSITEK